MPDPDAGEEELAAGPFSDWVAEIRTALRGDRPSDVPCGGCTACCASAQFVHIAPDETATLARIPPELLFRAPGMPAGHVVLGYDDRGRCPMLTDEGCSIYEHRPRTCRTYDCRIFPATGVAPGDDKQAIARRAARWRFDLATEVDEREHDAVRAAAAFLDDHGDLLWGTGPPPTPTERAVLAVEIHDRFLRRHPATGVVVTPDVGEVRRVLSRGLRPDRPE